MYGYGAGCRLCCFVPACILILSALPVFFPGSPCRPQWNSSINLGFKAAKVTFNRGSWFSPTVLNASVSFSHLTKYLGGCGISKETVISSSTQVDPYPYPPASALGGAGSGVFMVSSASIPGLDLKWQPSQSVASKAQVHAGDVSALFQGRIARTYRSAL